MNGESPGKEAGRVLAAFDAVLPGDDFWTLAARLADVLQSELRGLFVEDENLLRVSELPSAIELSPWSSCGRPMSIGTMETSLRNAADVAKRSLSRAAESARLPWSFETARGSLISESLRAFEQADVLLTAARRLSMLPSRPTGGPTVVVMDDSASGRRTLEAALRLRRRSGDLVVVLPYAHSNAEATWLQDRLARVGDASKKIRVVAETAISPEGCIRFVRTLRSDLVLVGRECSLFAKPTLTALLSGLPCSLGLVR